MKQLAIGLGAAAAVAAVVGALLPWTLSNHSIRAQLASQVRDATGLTTDRPARASFSVLPRPRIKLENVSIHDSANAFSLSAPVVKGDLRILALLAGKIQLSSVTFFQPKMVVDIDRNPMSARGAIARASGAAPASPEAAAVDSTPLAIVRLIGGEINFKSPSHKFETKVENVDAALDWRRLGAPASLTASGVWRDRPTHIAGWIESPSALLRGGESPVKLTATADILDAQLDGSLRLGGEWQFDGSASATSSVLPALTRWISADPDSPRIFGSASLSGLVALRQNDVSFANLRLALGDSNFEGSAALRETESGRPSLSATLATEDLTIAPYLSRLPKVFDSDGSWSGMSLPAQLSPIDLDLRVSATRAKLDRIELSDVGLAVLLADGRLDVSLPEAKAYNGTIKGRAMLTPSSDGMHLDVSGAFDKVETSTLLWDADDYNVLDGAGTGQFSLSSEGSTVAGLVRGLTGGAQFSLARGELVGVDFEQALRRIDKRPLSVAAEVHSGRTSFDALTGAIAFGNDKAELQNVILSGPGARVIVSGDAFLSERSLDMKAVAQQAGSDGAPSADGSRLTMKIEGYWDDPHLVLDAAGLVRRSEAAAPLFSPTNAAAHSP